jgi:hypothetical protein
MKDSVDTTAMTAKVFSEYGAACAWSDPGFVAVRLSVLGVAWWHYR